jgi:hypothetical protein
MAGFAIIWLVLAFSVFLFLALTILLLFAAGRRLVATGLVLFGLALVAFCLAYFVVAARTVSHRSQRTFHEARDLVTIRAETEAAARRHAADMQRAAEQVQQIEVQQIEMRHVDEVLLPPEQQASQPVIPIAPHPPLPPQPEAAVGEISSPEDIAVVSQAGDGPHETPPLEASAQGEDNAPPPVPPATEPAWVRQRPDQVDGHQAMVLTTDPFEDRFACNEDLERRTRELILGVARERCRQQGLPGDLPIRVAFDEIAMVARERFYQTRPTSLGDMVQAYQLTVVDDGFQTKLDQRIRDAVVDRRLIATGFASGSVLAVVSLLFGGFRFLARKAPDPLSA